MNRSYIKVEEIKKRIETENADEIAESLRSSRAILFRRLKNKEEKKRSMFSKIIKERKAKENG